VVHASDGPGSHQHADPAWAAVNDLENQPHSSDATSDNAESRQPLHVKYRPSPGRGSHKIRNERKACTGDPCLCVDRRTCPALSEARKRERQEAGIAALISLAASTAPTVIIPAVVASRPYSVAPDGSFLAMAPLRAQQAAAQQRPLDKLGALLRADHMVRNSLYLILSSGIQAMLGFAFWVIAARLFSPADVGTSSSLISATAVLAFAALLGLNSTFVRFLPTASDRNALITAGLFLVSVCGAGMGLLYVFLTPVIAPRLAFVQARPALAVGFALLTAAGAVNLLTDSVFVATRKAGYIALVDGGIGGVTKVVSAVLLAGGGAYGLFSANAGGFAAAALASLILMAIALRYRPSLKQPIQALKPLLHFSGANYAVNGLNLLPSLVVPLIALDRLGAATAAYYFVAFQLASLLWSAAYAVEQTFLAEGSHVGVDRRELLRRSRRILTALCLPACLALIVAAHWLLLAFGAKYSQHGTVSLIVLAVAALPIAANGWFWTVLRLEGRLRTIMASSAIYAVAICSLAWLLAPHGLTALSAAWPIGALLGAGVAAMPHNARARHRRTVREVS
jgi:O-antigen/teichoic acid export membrane protein